MLREWTVRGRLRDTLGAFAVAATLGGGNVLAVRLSNRELPPFWGAGSALRAGRAGVIAVALRLRWPRGRQFALIILYGALSFALSYAFGYWALVRVIAGVAAVVLAVGPLMTLLLAAAQGLKRLRARGALRACSRWPASPG